MRVSLPAGITLLLLLVVQDATSFQVPKPSWAHDVQQELTKGAFTLLVSGSLLFGGQQPAAAIDTTVYGSLQQAIIEASDAAYPVLQSLDGDTITPFANKISNVLTKKLNSEKLTNAVDSAANAILAIPDERLSQFTTIVTGAYKDVSADTCRAIPIPADAIRGLADSDGIRNLDAAKVSNVLAKVSTLQRSVPSSATGICLPQSPEGLEQIWLGQTELLLAIPKAAKLELASKASTAVKGIPNAELLRLLPEAKKVLGSVDRKVASKFQQTGQALDKIIKQDSRFQSLQSAK